MTPALAALMDAYDRQAPNAPPLLRRCVLGERRDTLNELEAAGFVVRPSLRTRLARLIRRP